MPEQEEDRLADSLPGEEPEGGSPGLVSGMGRRASRLPLPPDPEFDAAIEALRRGEGREEHEERAFKSLYPPLIVLFGNRGFSEADADDLAQKTLVRVFENIEDYRSDGHVWAWVKRIAMNVLANHFRDQEALKRQASLEVPLTEVRFEEEPSRRPSQPEPSEDPIAEQRVLVGEQSRLVRAALRELPERARKALVLWLGGLSYAEIADCLGVEVHTVGSQVHAAKKRLRRILAARLPELDDGEGR